MTSTPPAEGACPATTHLAQAPTPPPAEGASAPATDPAKPPLPPGITGKNLSIHSMIYALQQSTFDFSHRSSLASGSDAGRSSAHSTPGLSRSASVNGLGIGMQTVWTGALARMASMEIHKNRSTLSGAYVFPIPKPPPKPPVMMFPIIDSPTGKILGYEPVYKTSDNYSGPYDEFPDPADDNMTAHGCGDPEEEATRKERVASWLAQLAQDGDGDGDCNDTSDKNPLEAKPGLAEQQPGKVPQQDPTPTSEDIPQQVETPTAISPSKMSNKHLAALLNLPDAASHSSASLSRDAQSQYISLNGMAERSQQQEKEAADQSLEPTPVPATDGSSRASCPVLQHARSQPDLPTQQPSPIGHDTNHLMDEIDQLQREVVAAEDEPLLGNRNRRDRSHERRRRPGATGWKRLLCFPFCCCFMGAANFDDDDD